MSLKLRHIIGRWLFTFVLLQMLNIALGYDNHYHTGHSGHRHKIDLKSNGILNDTVEALEVAINFFSDNMMDADFTDENNAEEPPLLEKIELCNTEQTIAVFSELSFQKTDGNFSYQENTSTSYSELNSPPPKQSA